MVRRDYGLEALEAFIMEHARPNGTEHAQGGCSMQLDQMYPEGVRDVVVFHNFMDPKPASSLVIRHFTGSGHNDVKLTDEIVRLGLYESQTKTLVSRVVQAMLAQWATPKAKQFFYGHMWGSAILAMRSYGVDTDNPDLFKKTLLATVIYEGGHEKDPRGLVLAILPNPSDLPGQNDGRSTLQDVINYVLEVGCSEEELRTAWAEMLKIRLQDNFLTEHIVPWWRNLKVGTTDLHKEAEPVARALFAREMQDALVKGCYNKQCSDGKHMRAWASFMDMIAFIISSIDYDWRRTEEATELVEGWFVHCLANGWVGSGWYLLVRFGDSFRLWNESASNRMYPHMTVHAAMGRLMRAAIVKAEELRNYGIASAIAEHLDDTVEADRLREMARPLKQRVTLDFAFYLETKKY
ncbi:MAG: hypothetical protein HYV42_02440 [Candidatus Magasanikbacteria bacterium]|nr:hypothetical protein [Candidatus Magasanikbacteria bacterium]